jgi:hypothetical protein
MGADEKLKRTIATRRSRRRETPEAECRIRARRCATVVALLGLFAIPLAAPAAQDSPSEYQLKAAFVYNFAKFVDWPPNAYSGPQSPFAICILGDDPFGSLIDTALRGKTIADHPVVVRREKDAAAARRCQIVFISASEKRRLPEILEALKGANALIVGDFDGFATSGGAIELTLQDSHIRFAINPTAADSAGLRISSKLLALATIVHGTSESGKN